MPDPNWDSPDVIGKNYVWNEALGKWVPQALSTGTGSDVNVTNDPLNVNVTNAALVVHNYVWDPGTLDWVEQEQGAAGGGDASAANQTTEIGHLAAIETAVEALEPNPLTDAELRASAVPVSAASLPLPTGAATLGEQQTQTTALGTLVTTTNFDSKVGSLTEAAPATDTASSGLNGRLQRIAQRLSSLITALGSPFQAGGSIGNTTFASTVAEGANVVEGAVADAVVAAGASGTISAKLRAISRDIVANIVLAAGTATIGAIFARPETTGGVDTFRSIDLDETEEEVKATAGQVYGYYFANTHATSWRYLKFYNDTAANVAVGTTTPKLTLPLPPASAGHIQFTIGVPFSTAICVAATTGVADNDTGAPGANEVVMNVFYK